MNGRYDCSVLAHGGAGFYRTLLSVFMQQVLPKKIFILIESNSETQSIDVIYKAVVNDSEIYLPVELIECELKKDLHFYANVTGTSEQFMAFIAEGDFWFPEKNKKQFELMDSARLISCGYYQRQRDGSSQIQGASKKMSENPISTLLFNLQGEKNLSPQIPILRNPLVVVTPLNAKMLLEKK